MAWHLEVGVRSARAILLCGHPSVAFASNETIFGGMDLHHLRAFVAVAEFLSFRRAAERLHLSRPPLTRQIKALERELGVLLLARDGRRAVLSNGRRSRLSSPAPGKTLQERDGSPGTRPPGGQGRRWRTADRGLRGPLTCGVERLPARVPPPLPRRTGHLSGDDGGRGVGGPAWRGPSISASRPASAKRWDRLLPPGSFPLSR